MTQLDIEYGHDHRADEGWRRLLAAVRSGIEIMGLKEFSYRADERPQLVSDAMAARDRKHPKMRWLVDVLLAAPEYHRLAIVGVLADIVGCDLVKRRTLTTEERLARVEQALVEKLGMVGRQMLEEIGR